MRNLREEALSAAQRHADWLATYGPWSWDRYDFWAWPWARRAKAAYCRNATLGLSLVAPFVILDAVIPGSRALFGHRQRFATSDAHDAMGLCMLAQRHGDDGLRRALPFLEAIVEERCPGEEDCRWGYPFDWETCFGTWPAGTPLVTCTPYG